MSENLENLPEEIPSEETQVALPVSTAISYEGDADRSIVEEMETCYLDYAMSVIVSRALPDVRDGFKPVHRRILYVLHENGLRPGAKYRKSATIVGDVLGKYHPHGDSAVYDSMVRMAQDFSLRYPLVDGQGNFGSMDGDGAAAYRYTEAKMTRYSELMLGDIEKNTVDFRPNYDASREEPSVLPTRFPNLLCNGVMGIAVGMATNIPPHNLNEVVDAILYMLGHENPHEITVDDLLEFIKGPDFPTGGIVYDRKAIAAAYASGRGSVIMRGRAEIDELKSGKRAIIITEIPYQVNKKTLIEKIAELVTEKIVVGISDLRDESKGLGDIRIVIEMKKDAFPKKILNQLYKLTPLQTSFGYNMIALTERGMQPKLFNLVEIISEFIAHRREVVTRRTQYELGIAEARAHILEGLKIALDNIDAVIKTIKGSATKDEARTNLMVQFGLSEKQSDAILEMQLQRLAGLERKKIEDELAEKLLLIADLRDILAKPARVTAIVSDELVEMRDKFGDERRTEVQAGGVGEWSPKDTIPNEDVVITLSKNSYVKRIKSSAFRTQRRGGKGVTTTVKDEDEVKLLLSTRNHNDLLFFTNTGRVFRLPAYEIPEAQRTNKGQPIVNFIGLLKDEEVTAILDATNMQGKHYALISKKAIVKRIDVEDTANIRSSGLIVMKPKEDDELAFVRTTSGTDNMLLVSRHGKAIQFNEDDVRVMGRAAAGVRGMKIAEDDGLIEADIVSENAKFVFSVTETGMGKITSVDEYREQGRGGSGVKVGAVTGKTGDIIGVALLSEEIRKEGEVMLISRDGQTVRVPLSGVRVTSRVTQGIILAKLKNKNDAFTGMAIMKAGADEEEIPGVGAEGAENGSLPVDE
ncbi:MAG: DNA gyrase subunit A [Patescibacteria group bacterium]